MDPLDLKRSIVLAAFVGFLVVSMTIPFHQSIKGPCFTRPGAVWSLSRNGAGQITTGWERNYFNPGAPRILINADRPDFIEVIFMPELYDGAYVQAGDTIAFIESREGIGRQEILEAELKMSRAVHAATVAGAREEDIKVAKAELKRAKSAFEAYTPELARVKALYDAGLISDSTWQITKGNYDVLTAEVDVAEATINALQAGARPEDIAVAQEQIYLAELSLESSERLLGRREVITAPLNGEVRFRGDPEELIRIEMTDTLAVLASIPEATATLFREEQIMNVMLRGDTVPSRSCSLFRIDFGRPDLLGARAIGLLDNRDRSLQPGMTGHVRMAIGKASLFSGLRAKFRL